MEGIRLGGNKCLGVNEHCLSLGVCVCGGGGWLVGCLEASGQHSPVLYI